MQSVLVVEPDGLSALLLREKLERQGYRVEVATDQTVGLHALRERQFDLMFVEADQLGEELRAAAPARTVMTTAKLRSRVEPILERTKLRELLLKPIRNDELVELLTDRSAH